MKEDKVILDNLQEGLRANDGALTVITMTTKKFEAFIQIMFGTTNGLVDLAAKNLATSESIADIVKWI